MNWLRTEGLGETESEHPVLLLFKQTPEAIDTILQIEFPEL